MTLNPANSCAPTSPPWRRILTAFATFLTGFGIAALTYFSGKGFKMDDAVMSVLQDRRENPHGYLFASIGTAAGGMLLWSSARFFRKRLCEWSRTGSWLAVTAYRLGLASTVALGLSSPFETEIFSPLHVCFAYLAFIGLMAGLGLGLFLAARQPIPGRSWATALAAIQGGFAILIFLHEVLPSIPASIWPRPSLALFEWQVTVLNAVSIATLTALLARSGRRHLESTR